MSARAVVAILQQMVDDGAGMMLVSHNRRLVEHTRRHVLVLG